MIFVYDLNGKEYDLAGRALREYVWLDGTLVAMFTPYPANASNPPIAYFIHTDHLNTPRIVVEQERGQALVGGRSHLGRQRLRPTGRIGEPHAQPAHAGKFEWLQYAGPKKLGCIAFFWW